MFFGSFNFAELEMKVYGLLNNVDSSANLVIGLSEFISIDDALVGFMVNKGFEVMSVDLYVSGFSKKYSTSRKSTNLDS